MQPRSLTGRGVVVVLDLNGEIVAGRSITADGMLSPAFTVGNWAELPIVTRVLTTGKPVSGTDVIYYSYLATVGLERQALIDMEDTPKAMPNPFTASEGTAGLAIVGVYPTLDVGQINGAVLTAYLFNNDFTLVDYIKKPGESRNNDGFPRRPKESPPTYADD